MMTNTGTTIRLSVADISVIGRNTTGVKLISVDANKDVFVASFARVKETESDADIDMEPISPDEILKSENIEIPDTEDEDPDKDVLETDAPEEPEE